MPTTIHSGPLFEHIAGSARRLAAWRRANARDPALRAASQRRVEQLAWLLDSAIVLPGLGRRIGFDALIGLVPVVGDAAGFVLGSWIVFEAWRLGAPARLIAKMLGNLAVDTGVGAIPIAGDLFDAAWKANQRNAALLRAWLASTR
jgi:hypothetical protein